MNDNCLSKRKLVQYSHTTLSKVIQWQLLMMVVEVAAAVVVVVLVKAVKVAVHTIPKTNKHQAR